MPLAIIGFAEAKRSRYAAYVLSFDGEEPFCT